MGPSKTPSIALTSRGPVSLAPRLAARLSCLLRTPYTDVLVENYFRGLRWLLKVYFSVTFIVTDQSQDI